MPAVTADTTTLPTIPTPELTARERPVVSVTTAPSGHEGEGFPVRRAFAGVPVERLDPFIHMDQMGEVEYAPYEPKGTDWHPHRGFETVTYIIDGTFQHQDSHGGGGLITNGATQWMTAGSGILHIETPPEELVVSGGLFHGIQLWVNLPSADKMVAPRYQNLEADESALLVVARRRRAGAADRRGDRRPRRARRDAHADHDGPRHRGPRRPPGAAVADRLQRPRLRAGRARHGRDRAATGRGRPARRVRRRRLVHDRRRGRPRGAAARRAPDPRARRPVRPVRDEHQGRAGAGRRGLPAPAAWARSPTDGLRPYRRR